MLILDKKIQSLTDGKQINKESIIMILDTFRLTLESDLDALVKTGVEWIKDGDFIVIHSLGN